MQITAHDGSTLNDVRSFNMKRNMILAVALLLVTVFTAYPQQYDSESDFTVEIINGGKAVQITGYAGKNTGVRIPPQIKNLPVTVIGRMAFERKGITDVIIPNTITDIGDRAFTYNNITNVVIPDTVTSIGMGAFAFNKLNSIIIPKSIRVIQSATFGTNNLTSVIIPDNITSIGENAFIENPIRRITIGTNVSIVKYAFDNYFDDLYLETGKRAGTYNYYNDGKNIRRVCWYEFIENDFAGVILGDGRSVMITAYSGANKVITIPAQIRNLPVVRIYDWALYDKGIVQITVGANIKFAVFSVDNEFTGYYDREGKRAGNYYFRDDRWFNFIENSFAGTILSDGRTVRLDKYFGTSRELTIPALIRNMPVVEIGRDAFRGKNLTSVTIQNGVTIIGEDAFSQNPLTSIIIPNSVTTIKAFAFVKTNITRITIGANVSGDSYISFVNGFDNFYITNGKKAGTYTYSNGKWSVN